MGMHDPSSDEYRPYVPNSATPVPRPVIQAADIQAAVEAGDMEPALIVEPEGDGEWAVDALGHIKHVEYAEDESPGFEPPELVDDPSTGTFDEATGEFRDPERDSNDRETGSEGSPVPSGTRVADLPDENGADLEDADPGFIPADDEPEASGHEHGDESWHSHADGDYDHDSHG